MRLRVDLERGYVSYDESQSEKAWELFRERGIRIRKCKDVFDDGVVIEGKPIVVDMSVDRSDLN
jgi:hypothetical protein